MKKTVNFCGNCPFLYNEVDVYDGTVKHLCVLSKNLDLYFQYIDTVEGEFDENTTPAWCPLKSEDYTFTFKNFSNKRIDDIYNIKNKINEINEYIEFNENDDVDLSKEMSQINTLNSELSTLQKNEEHYEVGEDDIESEINKSIDEIKTQMSYIEEASSKLQDMFNNFSIE